VLFFQQQFGVGGISAEEGGTQNIPQTELALFAQDKWQPNPNLTIQYGLRWEMQKQPDPITPPSEVFYGPFIGQTRTNEYGTFRFPSDGTIPSDYQMWQPRLGLSWDPKGDGRTVVRFNAGIFYGRIPGLNLASSRSTNGSILQNAFRNSFLAYGIGVLPPPPAYPDLLPPETGEGTPFQPQVYAFNENFQNPRTYSASIAVERELVANLAALVQYNHSKGVHITRFFDSNDGAFGCPWSTGLGDDGSNGLLCGSVPDNFPGLATVDSSAKSLYDGITFGLTKRWADNYQLQANYTLSWDHSDDDNERDPFTLRYARYDQLDAEYGYSDRDQRHRLNAFLLWLAPGQVNVNLRYSYRSAQPYSLDANGQPAANLYTPARIRADGTVVERNTARKDNEFSALDLRLSREFRLSRRIRLEPILEVFNVFNSKNILAPQTTNLVFNFDGTIRAGLGEPRQMQLGARLIW
jgi:hypothetical protein